MCANLQTFRNKAFSHKGRHLVISSVIGHWNSRGLRRQFNLWKSQCLKEEAAEFVNEQGPIVEEVLREQLRFENCKNFLRDQAYTPSEVSDISDWAKGRTRELLARSVARLQHYSKSTDLYLKPKMFDRWKMFVKIRKLVRYLLRNMENKLHPVRADQSIAFNRWKYDKNHLLVGKDRAVLVKMSEQN